MATKNSIETIFAGLIALQFLIIATHDWVDVPRWIHGSQVQAVVGRRKLAWATLVNVAFPGTALAYAIWFFHQPKPAFVLNYWVIYTAITAATAFFMWWVPYLFGSSPARAEEYRKMYARTRHVLPVRKGDPGPNLVHLAFHGLFLTTLFLALALRLKAT
jgi:hypothetical protein